MTIHKTPQKRNTTTVTLPKGLVDAVQEIIDSGITNYPTKASLIRDTITKRVEEINKLRGKK